MQVKIPIKKKKRLIKLTTRIDILNFVENLFSILKVLFIYFVFRCKYIQALDRQVLVKGKYYVISGDYVHSFVNYITASLNIIDSTPNNCKFICEHGKVNVNLNKLATDDKLGNTNPVFFVTEETWADVVKRCLLFLVLQKFERFIHFFFENKYINRCFVLFCLS